MTELIYAFVITVALLLSYLAEKKRKIIFLVLLIALLSAISGFRNVSVGVDTKLYYYHIENGFPYEWQFRETGFRLLSNTIMDYFNNPQIVFVVCAFITNCLIVLRLWDFRKDASFAFQMFLYLLVFYAGTMTLMRQYVSIALIFYGTRYLGKKKYYLFLFLLIIAFFFHRASLLGFGYLVIDFWLSLSKKRKLLLFFPICVLGGVVISYSYSYLLGDIVSYTNQEVSNVNITYFYRVLVFVLAVILYKNKVVVKLSNGDIITQTKYILDNRIIYYTALGLALSSMGMFFNQTNRVGYFYLVYEMIFWGISVKKFNSKKFNMIVIGIFAIYVFMIELLRNGNLLFPYSIFLY